jgi:hypothetical protein
MVYSKVRGPGTVGLDASLSSEEVLATALEALEYFGIYAVSRAYSAEYAAQGVPVEPFTSQGSGAGTEEADVWTEVAETSLQPQSETRAPLSESTTLRRQSNSNSARPMNSRSSLGGKAGKQGASENHYGSGSIYSPENVDPQMMPELPDELITNRRISMGVYGMFSKL